MHESVHTAHVLGGRAALPTMTAVTAAASVPYSSTCAGGAGHTYCVRFAPQQHSAHTLIGRCAAISHGLGVGMQIN